MEADLVGPGDGNSSRPDLIRPGQHGPILSSFRAGKARWISPTTIDSFCTFTFHLLSSGLSHPEILSSSTSTFHISCVHLQQWIPTMRASQGLNIRDWAFWVVPFLRRIVVLCSHVYFLPPRRSPQSISFIIHLPFFLLFWFDLFYSLQLLSREDGSLGDTLLCFSWRARRRCFGVHPWRDGSASIKSVENMIKLLA